METLNLSIFADKTALFVDDDEVTREALEMILARRFKRVLVAENGKEALEMVIKENPDIIVTDIEMPVMNGIKLTEKIKELSSTKPVVILTAFADEAHLAKDADGVLIKPTNRDELFAVMIKVLQKR